MATWSARSWVGARGAMFNNLFMDFCWDFIYVVEEGLGQVGREASCAELGFGG
jgi:hypothetical protein